MSDLITSRLPYDVSSYILELAVTQDSPDYGEIWKIRCKILLFSTWARILLYLPAVWCNIMLSPMTDILLLESHVARAAGQDLNVWISFGAAEYWRYNRRTSSRPLDHKFAELELIQRQLHAVTHTASSWRSCRIDSDTMESLVAIHHGLGSVDLPSLRIFSSASLASLSYYVKHFIDQGGLNAEWFPERLLMYLTQVQELAFESIDLPWDHLPPFTALRILSFSNVYGYGCPPFRTIKRIVESSPSLTCLSLSGVGCRDIPKVDVGVRVASDTITTIQLHFDQSTHGVRRLAELLDIPHLQSASLNVSTDRHIDSVAACATLYRGVRVLTLSGNRTSPSFYGPIFHVFPSLVWLDISGSPPKVFTHLVSESQAHPSELLPCLVHLVVGHEDPGIIKKYIQCRLASAAAIGSRPSLMHVRTMVRRPRPSPWVIMAHAWLRQHLALFEIYLTAATQWSPFPHPYVLLDNVVNI
jgi:hypothetical protein